MRIRIPMPSLSAVTETGGLSRWRVRVGDVVSVGQILAEIEIDKGIMEYESPESGTVAALLVPEGGGDIPVGAAILELDR